MAYGVYVYTHCNWVLHELLMDLQHKGCVDVNFSILTRLWDASVIGCIIIAEVWMHVSL